MNLTDIIIIYFTCGAPFGVYHFFQKKNQGNWIYSLLVTLFWVPYAFKLLHLFVTKRFHNSDFDERTLSDSFERQFSQILLEENTDVSVFDFREIFERYSGLTKAAAQESGQIESELFQISDHPNNKLATKLLNRRNRSCLKVHQTLARRDFLRMIEKIDSSVFNKEKIRTAATDFVKLVNDVEALGELQRIFQNSTQSKSESSVNAVENEVWNPVEPKQLPMHQKALNFRTVSTVTTMSKPD